MNNTQKAIKPPGWKLVRSLGIVLALLSVCSVSLGVVDIILAALVLCKRSEVVTCSPPVSTSNGNLTESIIFSFVASGTWASVTVFATAILAINWTVKPSKSRNVLMTIGSMTAFIFVPAMIALSTIETYFTVRYIQETFSSTLSSTIVPTEITIKFVIPVIVACLALTEFLITTVVLFRVCSAKSPKTTPVRNQEEQVPTRGGGGGGGGGGGQRPAMDMYPEEQYDPAVRYQYSPYDFNPYQRPLPASDPYESFPVPYGYQRPSVQRYPQYPAAAPRYPPSQWGYPMSEARLPVVRRYPAPIGSRYYPAYSRPAGNSQFPY